MKILPINNYEPSYNARLPKAEVEDLIALSMDLKGKGIPKLYTLLDLLDKRPGKAAEFTTEVRRSKFRAMRVRRQGSGSFYPTSNYNILHIDNVEIKDGTGTKLDVLQSAVTDYHTKEGKSIPMPQSVFDKLWWKNRDKTVEDVRNLVL